MSAPFGRGNGFADPLKYAARLWEASRDQRKGSTASGNGTLDPDLEPEFNEPVFAEGVRGGRAIDVSGPKQS